MYNLILPQIIQFFNADNKKYSPIEPKSVFTGKFINHVRSWNGELESYCNILSFIKNESIDLFKNFYLPSNFVDDFIQCIFDDFVIEVFDTCLYQTLNVDRETQTAINIFGYPRSSMKLKAVLSTALVATPSYDLWNIFLAQNVKIIGNSTYISVYGGPAIITTLSMMDSKDHDLYGENLNCTRFINQHKNLLNSLEEHSNTWRDNISKYFPPELAFYHMENIWKLNYIATLLKYFEQIQMGVWIFTSTNPSAKTLPFFKHFSLEQVDDHDIEPFLSLLRTTERSQSGMQTKLCLMRYSLAGKIDQITMRPEIYNDLVSIIAPLINKGLWYCVLKNLIHKNLTGLELYQALMKYCSTFSEKALLKHYSPSRIDTLAPPISMKYRNYCFSKIASIVYNKKISLKETTSPKELQEQYSPIKDYMNQVTYSPELFTNDL